MYVCRACLNARVSVSVCKRENKPFPCGVSSCTISVWQHYTNILSPWHTDTLLQLSAWGTVHSTLDFSFFFFLAWTRNHRTRSGGSCNCSKVPFTLAKAFPLTGTAQSCWLEMITRSCWPSPRGTEERGPMRQSCTHWSHQRLTTSAWSAARRYRNTRCSHMSKICVFDGISTRTLRIETCADCSCMGHLGPQSQNAITSCCVSRVCVDD